MSCKKTVLFAITIDTEIDKSPSWCISEGCAYNSVVEGIPQLLTPLFDKNGAKPTYLLSPEVIEDEDCVRVLKGTKDCELGTHLHGELIEPERRLTTISGKRTSDMQCSYPPNIEFQKMSNLTNLFSTRFGRQPLSFRAGRFGACGNTISCLDKLGYLIDTSVTPSLCWRYPEGVADFTQADDQPYFPSPEDISSHGASRVLEVPVSIHGSKLGKALNNLEMVRERNLIRCVINHTSPILWLRPSHTSSSRMIQVIKELLAKNHAKKVVVLNMMFHTVEVIPKASPVAQSIEEVNALLERIDSVLRYGREQGFRFVTLSEIYPFYSPLSPYLGAV